MVTVPWLELAWWLSFVVLSVVVPALWIRAAFPSASRRCASIISEIVSTERAFISNLAAFESVFGPPLSIALPDPRPLGAVTLIRELHAKLLSKLEACGATRDGVSRTFIEMAPFFRLHVAFCTAHAELTAALTARLEMDPAFHTSIEALRTDRRVSGLDPFSFLIQPVQRLPRIVLLLGQLRDCTPVGHSQRENVTMALTKVREQTEALNEAKRDLEYSALLAHVQEQAAGLPARLLLPHRRVIKAAKIRLIGGSGIIVPHTTVMLIITNDVFVVVSERITTKVAKAANRAAKAAKLPSIPQAIPGLKQLSCHAMASNSEITDVIVMADETEPAEPRYVLEIIERVAAAVPGRHHWRSRFEIHWRTDLDVDTDPSWLRFSARDDHERQELIEVLRAVRPFVEGR